MTGGKNFGATIQSKYGGSASTLNMTRKDLTYLRKTDFAPEKTWATNCKEPDFIDFVPGLDDGTHTPRGRAKAISLERNFEKRVWMPNKQHPSELKMKQKKRYGQRI